ncbi:unnamed protein product [Amoebophrya sp. A25]|nr:unnamed protein product [Amoebophrya sp. A25]|eukprot:GSA25T00017133001.1
MDDSDEEFQVDEAVVFGHSSSVDITAPHTGIGDDHDKHIYRPENPIKNNDETKSEQSSPSPSPQGDHGDAPPDEVEHVEVGGINGAAVDEIHEETKGDDARAFAPGADAEKIEEKSDDPSSGEESAPIAEAEKETATANTVDQDEGKQSSSAPDQGETTPTATSPPSRIGEGEQEHSSNTDIENVEDDGDDAPPAEGEGIQKQLADALAKLRQVEKEKRLLQCSYDIYKEADNLRGGSNIKQLSLDEIIKKRVQEEFSSMNNFAAFQPPPRRKASYAGGLPTGRNSAASHLSEPERKSTTLGSPKEDHTGEGRTSRLASPIEETATKRPSLLHDTSGPSNLTQVLEKLAATESADKQKDIELESLKAQIAVLQSEKRDQEEDFEQKLQEKQDEWNMEMSTFSDETLQVLEKQWMRYEDLWTKCADGRVGSDEASGRTKIDAALKALTSKLRTEFVSERELQEQQHATAIAEAEKQHEAKLHRVQEHARESEREKSKRSETRLVADFEARLALELQQERESAAEASKIAEKAHAEKIRAEKESSEQALKEQADTTAKEINSLQEQIEEGKKKLAELRSQLDTKEETEKELNDLKKRQSEYALRVVELQLSNDKYALALEEREAECAAEVAQLQEALDKAEITIAGREQTEQGLTQVASSAAAEEIRRQRQSADEQRTELERALRSEFAEKLTDLQNKVVDLETQNDRLLCERDALLLDLEDANGGGVAGEMDEEGESAYSSPSPARITAAGRTSSASSGGGVNVESSVRKERRGATSESLAVHTSSPKKKKSELVAQQQSVVQAEIRDEASLSALKRMTQVGAASPDVVVSPLLLGTPTSITENYDAAPADQGPSNVASKLLTGSEVSLITTKTTITTTIETTSTTLSSVVVNLVGKEEDHDHKLQELPSTSPKATPSSPSQGEDQEERDPTTSATPIDNATPELRSASLPLHSPKVTTSSNKSTMKKKSSSNAGVVAVPPSPSPTSETFDTPQLTQLAELGLADSPDVFRSPPSSPPPSASKLADLDALLSGGAADHLANHVPTRAEEEEDVEFNSDEGGDSAARTNSSGNTSSEAHSALEDDDEENGSRRGSQDGGARGSLESEQVLAGARGSGASSSAASSAKTSRRKHKMGEKRIFAFEEMLKKMAQVRSDAEKRIKAAEDKLELETKGLMSKFSQLEERHSVLSVRNAAAEQELLNLAERRDALAVELKVSEKTVKDLRAANANQESALAEAADFRVRQGIGRLLGVLNPKSRTGVHTRWKADAFGRLRDNEEASRVKALEKAKEDLENKEKDTAAQLATESEKRKTYEKELEEMGFFEDADHAADDDTSTTVPDDQDSTDEEDRVGGAEKYQLDDSGVDDLESLLADNKIGPLVTVGKTTAEDLNFIAGELSDTLEAMNIAVGAFPELYAREYKRSVKLRRFVKGMKKSFALVLKCGGFLLDLSLRQHRIVADTAVWIASHMMAGKLRLLRELHIGSAFARWRDKDVACVRQQYADMVIAAGEEQAKCQDLERDLQREQKRTKDLEHALQAAKRLGGGVETVGGSSSSTGSPVKVGCPGAGRSSSSTGSPVKVGCPGAGRSSSAVKGTGAMVFNGKGSPLRNVLPGLTSMADLTKHLDEVAEAAKSSLLAGGGPSSTSVPSAAAAPTSEAAAGKPATSKGKGKKAAPPPIPPGSLGGRSTETATTTPEGKGPPSAPPAPAGKPAAPAGKAAAPPVPGSGKAGTPPVPGGGKGDESAEALPSTGKGRGAAPPIPGGKGATPPAPGGKAVPPAPGGKGAPVPGGKGAPVPGGKGAPPPGKGAAPPGKGGAAPPGATAKGGKGKGKKGGAPECNIPVHAVPEAPKEHTAKALHWQKIAPKQYEKSIFAKLLSSSSTSGTSTSASTSASTAASTSGSGTSTATSGPSSSSTSLTTVPTSPPRSAQNKLLGSPPSSNAKLRPPGSSSKLLRGGAGAAHGTTGVPLNFSTILHKIRTKSSFDRVCAHFLKKIEKPSTNGPQGGAGGKTSATNVKVLTTLLDDASKAQNIEIALRSRQITADQVRRRLDDYDTEALSFESLQMVVAMYPNSEEIGQLKKEYDKSGPPLRGAEDFLLGLLEISNFKQKAECVSNVELFPKLFEETKEGAAQLQNLCEQLLKSGALQVVFFLAMQIGNFLNQGTAKGNAFGFSLETLEKFPQTNSFVAKDYSLAHALCEELWLESRESLKSFFDDTKSCEEAARVDFAEVKKHAKDLEAQVEFVRRAMGMTRPGEDLVVNSTTPLFGSTFTSKMESFVLEKEADVRSLQEQIAKVDTLSSELVEFLAAKNGTPLKDCLGILSRFRKCLTEALRVNQERQLKERKRKEKEDSAKRVAEKLMATVGGGAAKAKNNSSSPKSATPAATGEIASVASALNKTAATTVAQFCKVKGDGDMLLDVVVEEEKVEMKPSSPPSGGVQLEVRKEPVDMCEAHFGPYEPPEQMKNKTDAKPANDTGATATSSTSVSPTATQSTAPTAAPASSSSSTTSSTVPTGPSPKTPTSRMSSTSEPAVKKVRVSAPRKGSTVTVDGEEKRVSTLLRKSRTTAQYSSSSDEDG